MRIGDLRDRLTLQSVSYASSTQSGHGAASFSTLATVWGAVRSSGGNEELESGSVTSRVRYDVEIRHRTDVTPRMRVLWTPYTGSSRTLEILAVQFHPTMTDRLVLQCAEAV